jgi:adenylate cyclase
VRAALLLAVAAVAAGAGLLAYATSALGPLENNTVDARFSLRGEEKPSNQVVFLQIDRPTLEALRSSWPIPRIYHARAIDRLRKAGAKVIVYDVQFTEPGPKESDDLALFDATQRAGNVVLATTEVNARGQANIFGDPANLRDARGVAGNANFRADSDGTFRRFPYSVDGLKSLSVAAVERSGRKVSKSDFDDGDAWIDYAGKAGTIPTYSFGPFLKGRVPDSAVRGKIVFVGLSVPSEQDVHPTSVGGGLMPGAEIQASSAATILEGFPLEDAPGWLAVLVILVAGVATPLTGLRVKGLTPMFVAAAVLAGLALAAYLAFGAGTILPVVSPLLALLLATVGTLGVYAFTELRERRRLRNEFARFVPASVVDEVVNRTDDDLRLGGVRIQGTVMFCDLRGFTTWAETQPAETVIQVLNRYLTEMSDAILDEGGTVVSYMGDGIMAVFGAPIEQSDHADRSLRAARQMLGRCLPSFNAWLAEQGLGDGFRMGIGLNSGPVMSGNVGSERRLEYAAVGDTTNTASRIESLTKDTPHQLLVAESTKAGLDDQDGLVEAGEFTLRGREQAVRMWTLSG